MAEVGPVNDAVFICHTNHSLANDDYVRGGVREMAKPDAGDNTRIRYQAVEEHLAADPARNVIEPSKKRPGRTTPRCVLSVANSEASVGPSPTPRRSWPCQVALPCSGSGPPV